jgi:hypothetical protein
MAKNREEILFWLARSNTALRKLIVRLDFEGSLLAVKFFKLSRTDEQELPGGELRKTKR